MPEAYGCVLSEAFPFHIQCISLPTMVFFNMTSKWSTVFIAHVSNETFLNCIKPNGHSPKDNGVVFGGNFNLRFENSVAKYSWHSQTNNMDIDSWAHGKQHATNI